MQMGRGGGENKGWVGGPEGLCDSGTGRPSNDALFLSVSFFNMASSPTHIQCLHLVPTWKARYREVGFMYVPASKKQIPCLTACNIAITFSRVPGSSSRLIPWPLSLSALLFPRMPLIALSEPS